MAARAIEAWHAANQAILDAQKRRNEAFILMAQSGMVANQIAKATGLTRQGVVWLASDLHQKLRKVDVRPTRTSSIVERVTRKGSILFGD